MFCNKFVHIFSNKTSFFHSAPAEHIGSKLRHLGFWVCHFSPESRLRATADSYLAFNVKKVVIKLISGCKTYITIVTNITMKPRTDDMGYALYAQCHHTNRTLPGTQR